VQTLIAQPLTQAAFAPFGEVLSFDPAQARPVNDGRAMRADCGLALDSGGREDHPVLAIYRARGEELPFVLTTFERHPLSSQVFVALTAARFLIVVAPASADGLPDPTQARAFVGMRGEGVNYARNVWHAPITAIGQEGDFLMLMWERGMPEDCILHAVAHPLLVSASDQS
jgi:ureidoglycolate lyase